MNSNVRSADQYQSTVSTIMNLLKQRRVDEAVNACLAFSRSNPESNDALLLLGKARQMQGRFEDMLKLIETALGRDPESVDLQLQFAGACQFCGQHDLALVQLVKAEQSAHSDAELLQKVAQHYTHARKYVDAHRCYLRAVELDGNNSRYLNNLAASFIAVGELQQAEDAYTGVIDRSPKNFEAWYNRSTLRKQTEEENHVRKLEKALKKLAPDDIRETQLCYTLAKEYEDLGNDQRSFFYLKRGGESYRRRSAYDVQLDVSLMNRISGLFDAAYAASVKSAPERRGPIFVLGLPRSGTTLIDRIVGSHSRVESMGEIEDFARTLNLLGKTTDRKKLLESCVRIDPDQLGQCYIRSVRSYGVDAQYFIDKTPINFLYIGLIAKALPGASIVHIRRHPVDSCLSMYRALFRAGYPFSYSLGDLAEYYIAYDALMKHWHTVFPNDVFDVAYEDLVDDQERVSQQIFARCGLDWEAACLEFDKNSAPVSTASAVQVRKPIYRDAIARWRRFETQLEPLIKRLQDAGIEI